MNENMKNEKAKFTPGPWSYRPNKYDDWGVVKSPDGLPVAQACVGRWSKDFDKHRTEGTDPAEANARLIAAAPELLAALEMQAAAFSALSMAHYYQDSMEGAKDWGQKQYSKNAYLEAAKEADLLQDKASEMRRAAIAKAKGE